MSHSNGLSQTPVSTSGTSQPVIASENSFADWGWDLDDSDFSGSSPLDDVDNSDDLLDEAENSPTLFQFDRVPSLEGLALDGLGAPRPLPELNCGPPSPQPLQRSSSGPIGYRKRSLSFLSGEAEEQNRINCSVCPCCKSEAGDSESSFLNHVKTCFMTKAELPNDTTSATVTSRPRSVSCPEFRLNDGPPEDARLISDLRSCLNRVDLRARIQVIESLSRIARLSSSKMKPKRQRRCVLPSAEASEAVMKEQDYKVLSMLLSSSVGAHLALDNFAEARHSHHHECASPRYQSSELHASPSPISLPITKDPSMSFDCFFSEVSTPPLTSKSFGDAIYPLQLHTRTVPKSLPRDLSTEYNKRQSLPRMA